MINRKLFLAATAVLAGALVSPVEAKPDHDRGGGRGRGGGGGGGAPRAVAPAAPRVQARAPMQARVQSRPQAAPRAQSFRGGGGGGNRAQIAQSQNFRARAPQSPSIAFGGSSPMRTRAAAPRNFTQSTTVQNFNRPAPGAFRPPPSDIHRDWNRDRVHVWNNHRYGWRNNSWVILDSGYPYYGGYYGGAPYTYSYDYDDSTPVVTSTVNSGSDVVEDVQEELARAGYSPGPVDGVLGGQTRSAIAAFQRDHGLMVTARIDSNLLTSLGID